MEYLPFTRPSIDEETIQGVVEVFRGGQLATGPVVKTFETQLSQYLGGRIIKSFTSATGALEVVLEALGIGKGDEVILPAMSFVATANVIVRVGAKPVFVDVELDTRNIDMNKVEKALTSRTKAIMPVHFAGRPVDMDRLYAFATKHKLRVIEDAAHAIGTSYKGKLIGSFGDIVVFSFHPNKNMTTIEGGAISMVNPEEARRVDLLRFHGIEKDEQGNMDVKYAAGKFNLTDVAARVGIGQLRRLSEFNTKRRHLVDLYFKLLQSGPEFLLPLPSTEDHSWHMFNPLLPLSKLSLTRHQFIEEMHKRGIGVGIHYPPMHLFSFYRTLLGHKENDFPNAERIGRETVTLPLFPAMGPADVERVCVNVNEIFQLFL